MHGKVRDMYNDKIAVNTLFIIVLLCTIVSLTTNKQGWTDGVCFVFILKLNEGYGV